MPQKINDEKKSKNAKLESAKQTIKNTKIF